MKYKIITLGCKVNEYESEVISNLLENHGYIKSENPDVCIINTCTVTNTLALRPTQSSKRLLNFQTDMMSLQVPQLKRSRLK